MKILASYTERGDGIENEDCFGIKDNCFWIIDGATDLFRLNLFGCNDDVAYYVRQLNECIKETVDDNESLVNIIRKSIEKTNRMLNLYYEKDRVYQYPSFAFLIVRLHKDVCEYCVLGDCVLQVKNRHDIIKVTDQRIYQFSKKNRNGLERLKKEGKLVKENELGIYKETRTLMNIKNGYWIGSVDGKGIDKSIQGEISLDSDSLILGYSDGLLEVFDLFKIAKEDENIFSADVLRDIVRALRKCQSRDYNRIYTRVRRKDDLTYVLVR